MDPLDLPPFDVLVTAFDDDEDVIAPWKDGDGLYDPIPINYNSPEDNEVSILSASVSSLVNFDNAHNGKVPAPCFLQATSFASQENEMSNYTTSLSNIESTRTKAPHAHKKKTRKTKPRAEVVIEGLEKPKKALDAYGIYLQHERVKILATSDVDFDTMDAAISLKWKAVDPSIKAYYGQLADHEKDRYEKDMIQYRKKRRALLKKQRKLAAAAAAAAATAKPQPKPASISPTASCGDLPHPKESYIMADLAQKLGEEATHDLVQMFL